MSFAERNIIGSVGSSFSDKMSQASDRFAASSKATGSSSMQLIASSSQVVGSSPVYGTSSSSSMWSGSPSSSVVSSVVSSINSSFASGSVGGAAGPGNDIANQGRFYNIWMPQSYWQALLTKSYMKERQLECDWHHFLSKLSQEAAPSWCSLHFDLDTISSFSTPH